MFYKLIDKYTLGQAPDVLHIDGKDVFTNSEEIYNSQGYYRVEETDYPDEGKIYKPIYQMGDNVILQMWEEVVMDEEEIQAEDETILSEPEVV